MKTTTIENFRLTAALCYARMGWPVIPLNYPKTKTSGEVVCSCNDPECESVGKHPLTANGLKDATTEEQAIRRWWTNWPSANIGIATGEDSGIIVLDVDPRDGGTESLGNLMDENGELPETVEAETGSIPSGTHLVFRHPGVTVRNSAGKLGPGLDIRGDGGYIVVAPSLHWSGQRYAWKPGAAPDEYSPSAMPEWLLAKLRPAPVVVPTEIRSRGDAGTHWLCKALIKANVGNRNDTGFWLAQQLRDAGLSENEAAGVMRDYAERVPRGEKAYTDREALATLRSAYQQPPRAEAKPQSFAAKVIKFEHESKPATTSGAAAELSDFYAGVASGEISNIPLPWPLTTKGTQCLMPGSITVLCADPGAGKTMWALQCLQHWHEMGYPAAAFFIEKNRLFYTRRLLAQLEQRWEYLNLEWAKQNASEIATAIDRHKGKIDALGKWIMSEPDSRVTLDSLLAWVRQMASAGKRVIVIDPITAASAGDKRWLADEDFMMAAQKVVIAHGASLLLVTHPKKGNRPGSPSGHDVANGAAYYRNTDTLLWLRKCENPRCVKYRSDFGIAHGKFSLFLELHKTRDGGGGGNIAFAVSEGGIYTEQGLVLKEVKGDEAEDAEDVEMPVM